MGEAANAAIQAAGPSHAAYAARQAARAKIAALQARHGRIEV
jgi:hypothetical protein